jgi:hypothetical protein
MATVHQVKELADFQGFLKDTSAEGPYGECHNALTWLAVQIKKAELECTNVWLCTGTFARHDHSWIVIEDTDIDRHTVIDLTVQQFGWEGNIPYVGPVSPGYDCHYSVLLSDEAGLPYFIDSLG